MKKYAFIILVLMVTVNLTACKAPMNNENSSPEISNVPSGLESDNSVLSEALSSESVSDSSEFEIDSFPNDFPLEYITMPDGSVVSKYEGESTQKEYLNLDWSYIRYAQPEYYHCTDEEPDLVDWDTDELFQIEPTPPIKNKEFFKVKKGDKLKNGLTVRSALYTIYQNGEVSIATVEFDGELELTGRLYHLGQNDGVHYRFYPNKDDIESIPVIKVQDYMEHTSATVDRENKWAWISDIVDFRLHNYMSVDLSGIITPDTYADIKVVLKDIRLESSDNGVNSDATIVSVKPL